ncbi:MAG: glycosyltransferase [candidate division KSB1 bacterium]|nr:glycosyltransferase [candidate division KSB1 bacterium]
MPDQGRKIRVLYLIPSLRTGGAELQLLTLVRGLDKSRFAVSVAVFYEGGFEQKLKEIAGVHLIRLGKKHGFDPVPFIRLLRELCQYPQDILHAFNLSARFIGLLCGRIAHVPIVVLAERTDRPIVTSFGSRLYSRLDGLALGLADYVIANSRGGLRFALQRGVRAERVSVIPNGIDRQRLLPKRSADEMRSLLKLPKESFVIGMLGRLEPSKEPERFLAVFEAVARSDASVRGLVVGDGSSAERLQRKVQQLQLGDRLLFVGRQEEPSDFLQIMNVLVHPSLGAEGCPNAVLEAMAMGIPVIAGRTNGAAEIIDSGRTGVLIESSDPAKWAEAVLRLRDEPELRRRLGENARRRVTRDFSAETMVAAHAELYEQWYRNAKSRTTR